MANYWVANHPDAKIEASNYVKPGSLVKIVQTANLADFTDGGGTSGTLVLTGTIPVGAFVQQSVLTSVTGFVGDTSAVLTIGDGTDVDRYNTSTINVFADIANGVGCGAVSGTAYHDTAKSVTLTITAGSDWGAVTGGSLTVEIYYLT